MQPQTGDLVRAVADVRLMGSDGYRELYVNLRHAVDRVVWRIQAAGMVIFHAHNRSKGSSVIAVEDPSGAVCKRMRRLGHSTGVLCNMQPEYPSRCQTGWQLSITPHQLRLLDGGKSALDVFVDDLVWIHEAVQADRVLNISRKLFRESSLPAHFISRNLDPFMISLLAKAGLSRSLVTLVIRRAFCTGQLDGGTLCFRKRRDFVRELKRIVWRLLSALFMLLLFRRRHHFLGGAGWLKNKLRY